MHKLYTTTTVPLSIRHWTWNGLDHLDPTSGQPARNASTFLEYKPLDPFVSPLTVYISVYIEIDE